MVSGQDIDGEVSRRPLTVALLTAKQHMRDYITLLLTNNTVVCQHRRTSATTEPLLKFAIDRRDNLNGDINTHTAQPGANLPGQVKF